MKKTGKILCLFAVIFLLLAIPAFSQTGLKDLQNTVNDFSESLAKSLPFNATIGLNWSDSHIGQLLTIPPHLGIGITTGFTTMDFGSLNGVLKKFNAPLPDSVNIGGFPLPGYTVDARIGGILLPFDIGVKFGYLQLPDGLIPDFKLDYMLVGGDIRYAVLGGKKAISPLKVSVGVGFNYLKGGIGMPVPGANNISFAYSDPLGGSHSLEIQKPEVGLNWETKSLDFKAQASLKVLILTPYIGVGASHAWSSAGYEVTSKITVDGNPITDSDINTIKNNFGISGIDENGFSQINEVTGWSFRAFGGLSVNLPFVKFDLTGMYDFLSQCYGATFGIRLQI